MWTCGVGGARTGGADEGEVERVEEEHDVLAVVIGEVDVDELLVEHSLRGEVRRRVANQGRRLQCA